MPRVTLSPSQLASAREIAEKAARVMSNGPDGLCWRNLDGSVHFSLNGTDPDEDAKATARMKKRLIEWTLYIVIIYGQAAPEYDLVEVCVQADCFLGKMHCEFAPIEVLAVAQALIAVDEERRKGGK